MEKWIVIPTVGQTSWEVRKNENFGKNVHNVHRTGHPHGPEQHLLYALNGLGGWWQHRGRDLVRDLSQTKGQHDPHLQPRADHRFCGGKRGIYHGDARRSLRHQPRVEPAFAQTRDTRNVPEHPGRHSGDSAQALRREVVFPFWRSLRDDPEERHGGGSNGRETCSEDHGHQRHPRRTADVSDEGLLYQGGSCALEQALHQ